MIRTSSNEYIFNNRISVARLCEGDVWRILDLETMEFFSLDEEDEKKPWYCKDLAVALDVVHQNRMHKLERPTLNQASEFDRMGERYSAECKQRGGGL